MSATAQKQDLSDPDVINAFAARVGDDRHLVALYLLTVADIRGTSPKVWNAWKAKLLEDLFWLTRRRLSGDTRSLESSLQQRQDAVKAKLRLYAIHEQAHEKLWSQLDVAYFLRHDADEIAWHTRLLNYRVDTPTPVVKARLSPAGEGLQVMIYVRDQKDLFARICSFFERISYSIVEAKIYTTRHGYALDSFQILDPNNKKPQYRDLIGYIEYELGQRLVNQTPLEPPTAGPREPPAQAFSDHARSQHRARRARRLQSAADHRRRPSGTAVARRALPRQIRHQSAHRQDQYARRPRGGRVPDQRRGARERP